MHESMFETFLKTAHQNDKKADDERALVEAMKKLPPEVLFKLASGETKLGSSYLKACSPSGCEGMEWVEQFKDTPLFEQALQLEQQAIQLEQMEQQYRAQRDAEREQEPKFWEMQDRIRLQKRVLGLQLAAGQLQQAGAAGGAAPMAPGGAPPLPPAAAEAAGGAPPPADGKVAFALTERGHKFDTERASLKREHLLDEARLHQRYNALGHNDPETNTNPAKLVNVFRFGPDISRRYHPTAEARHQAYVAAQHAQGRNAYNPFGGLLTPVPEEQGATSGLLGVVGKVGPKKEEGAKKEAFDRAAALGQRMAQGDYERAVATNFASELGRSLAKTAFAVTDAGHKFDAADYGAQRDMIGKRREARQEYRAAAPGMHAAHTALELGGLAAGAAPIMALGSPGLASEVADMLRERHANYAAGRHAVGHNAYNPLGGLLTPTARETKAKEKKALDTSALAGLGQKAVGFLSKNPGAALGAAAGAAGGLAHGMQKDQNGQRHLLSGLAQGAAGAAGGALAGHAAQNIGGAVRGGASLGQAAKSYGQQLQQAGGQAVGRVQAALKPAAAAPGAAPAAPAAAAAKVAPTVPMGQGRVAPTLPGATANPSLIAATNQSLNFARAPQDVQAAIRSNPLVASGQIGPEQAHQLMSWSTKGTMTPQAVAQLNSKTPRPAGFVDPREAATRVGG